MYAFQKYDGHIPTFGRITHFVVNSTYNDDACCRRVYNLNGHIVLNPSEEDQHIYDGRATLMIKGHDLAMHMGHWFKVKEG